MYTIELYYVADFLKIHFILITICLDILAAIQQGNLTLMVLCARKVTCDSNKFFEDAETAH